MDPETISDLELQIEDFRERLQGRPLLPPSAPREIEVSNSGYTDLKIELADEN